MSPLIQSLMNQLKNLSSNNFKIANDLMKSGGDPNAILQQMLGKINPDFKQKILNQAKGYGCPDTFLSKLQNMK